MLGDPRSSLERHVTGYSFQSDELGSDDDMEGHSPDRGNFGQGLPNRKAANEVRDAILGSSIGARRIDTALERDDTAAVDTLDVTVNDKSSPLQPTKVLVRSACKHYPW